MVCDKWNVLALLDSEILPLIATPEMMNVQLRQIVWPEVDVVRVSISACGLKTPEYENEPTMMLIAPP